MVKKRTVATKTILAWVLSLIILVPLAILLLASLKTKREAAAMSLSWPAKLQFSNYAEAIKRGGLWRAFGNSLLVSLVSATVCSLVSALAAFVMQRSPSLFNNAAYNYIFVGLMAPINYVTTIKVYQIFHLNNTFAGMILLFVAMGIPFAVFVYHGFLATVPRELDEAATIDGAGPLKLFMRIVFPLLKPVTMTVFVLNLMGAWNDFISPLYMLNSQAKWPMVMSVYNFFGMHFNEWHMISAVIVMSVLPVIVLYIFCQKYVVAGMMSGSVKQ